MVPMHFRMTDQNINFQGLPFHHFILKDPVTDSKGDDKEEKGGKNSCSCLFFAEFFPIHFPFFLPPLSSPGSPRILQPAACSLVVLNRAR